MSDHTYQLDLYQVARVHTETFTVEATDKDNAQAQADEIAKSKGLKKDFDFEIKDLSVQASAGATEPDTAPNEPAQPEETPPNEPQQPDETPADQPPVPEVQSTRNLVSEPAPR